MTGPNLDTGLASLDRDSEPWIGHLAGLGRIRVHADGRYEVTVDADAPPGADEVLTFGWAALLGHIRRGRRILLGTSMTAPGSEHALLISGGVQQQAEVSIRLAERGWLLVADAFTPADLSGIPTVHPRGGPWLVPRHLPGTSPLLDEARIRPGATAQVVASTPVTSSLPLRARLTIVDRGFAAHAPTDCVVPVAGRERMGVQHQVLTGMSAGETIDPAQVMADDLAVSRLPLAVVRWPHWQVAAEEDRTAALGRLIEWWEGLGT